MNVTMRPLGADDASLFSDLRLESLQACPGAYSMDPEIWEKASLQDVAALLTPGPAGFMFGAFQEDELIGILGVRIKPRWKASHMGTLWGLYVRPNVRHQGIGQGLMEAVLAESRATGDLEQLRLMVPEDSEGARSLFSAQGFEEYGFETRGRRTSQGYINLVYMMRFL